MSSVPFSFVELPPERSVKPRRAGLTMIVDAGLPLAAQEDLLRLAGRYVDLAKIKTGTARLYDAAYLRRKLAAYRRNGVRPFLGGQFHEYVFATLGAGALERFYAEALRLGFAVIEISDNCVPLTPRQRRGQIRAAIAAGLAVFGEVGSKAAGSSGAALVSQARDAFDAGAELVLVEAAELIANGRPNRRLIEALRRGLDMGRVLIELPGPWISGAHHCDIEDMKKFLVRELGPDVNLANVLPEDLIDVESLRVGLGVVGPEMRARAGS